MRQNQQLLHQAINEGLLSLGEPIMKTIVWHMNHRGLFLDSPQLDIRVFYDVLQEIVGNVRNEVMEQIYKDLRNHYPGNIEKIIRDPVDKRMVSNLPPSTIDRIEQLLQVEAEGAGS